MRRQGAFAQPFLVGHRNLPDCGGQRKLALPLKSQGLLEYWSIGVLESWSNAPEVQPSENHVDPSFYCRQMMVLYPIFQHSNTPLLQEQVEIS